MTWQLLYPNWLDLILSNTGLPCPIQLHQPLSLLSRTSALSPVTTTKFKFYSIMSPPKRIPHLALSIVTAYPKSYLSIYNPSLSDPTHRLPFLNRYLHISIDIYVLIPTFEVLSWLSHLPNLSLSTLSTLPQHSHHVPIPGTIALPSTIPRYILPTPPSYYHAASS